MQLFNFYNHLNKVYFFLFLLVSENTSCLYIFGQCFSLHADPEFFPVTKLLHTNCLIIMNSLSDHFLPNNRYEIAT